MICSKKLECGIERPKAVEHERAIRGVIPATKTKRDAIL
jgi:hypothetical protein